MTDNLELWNSVEGTDPASTKKAKKSGFNFTSVNPMTVMKRATEVWGPCGGRWGITSKGSIHDSSDESKVWVEEVEIYYPLESGERGTVSHYGVCMFCYRTHGENGYLKTDEEAPKKAKTNGISKTLSLLGFCADLWLGYYESEAYVKSMSESFSQKREASKEENIFKRLTKMIEHTGAGDTGTKEADLVCRLWSEGRYGSEDAFEDADIAKEVLLGQSNLCKTVPVAKQLQAAIEFSEKGLEST